MPCAKVARGAGPAAAGSPLPFNDVINNNPCGKPALLTVNAVSVAAENLCQFHWMALHGSRDYVLPVTKEP